MLCAALQGPAAENGPLANTMAVTILVLDGMLVLEI